MADDVVSDHLREFARWKRYGDRIFVLHTLIQPAGEKAVPWFGGRQVGRLGRCGPT